MGQRVSLELLRALKGRPWAPADGTTIAEAQLRQPGAAERLRRFQEEEQVPDQPAVRTRRLILSPEDIERHGFTYGCPGCEVVRSGGKKRNHTEDCRQRIVEALKTDPAASRRLEAEGMRLWTQIQAEQQRRDEQEQRDIRPTPPTGGAAAAADAYRHEARGHDDGPEDRGHSEQQQHSGGH